MKNIDSYIFTDITKMKVINKNYDSDHIMLFLTHHLGMLNNHYPDFHLWLKEQVIPGLKNNERRILLEYRANSLAGIAIIKDTPQEKKLCCLRILPEFRNFGVGLKLFERSFEELNTCSPLLSIAEEQLIFFEKIFKYYKFEVGNEYIDIYRPHKYEYSFNGILK